MNVTQENGKREAGGQFLVRCLPWFWKKVFVQQIKTTFIGRVCLRAVNSRAQSNNRSEASGPELSSPPHIEAFAAQIPFLVDSFFIIYLFAVECRKRHAPRGNGKICLSRAEQKKKLFAINGHWNEEFESRGWARCFIITLHIYTKGSVRAPNNPLSRVNHGGIENKKIIKIQICWISFFGVANRATSSSVLLCLLPLLRLNSHRNWLMSFSNEMKTFPLHGALKSWSERAAAIEVFKLTACIHQLLAFNSTWMM